MTLILNFELLDHRLSSQKIALSVSFDDPYNRIDGKAVLTRFFSSDWKALTDLSIEEVEKSLKKYVETDLILREAMPDNYMQSSNDTSMEAPLRSSLFNI